MHTKITDNGIRTEKELKSKSKGRSELTETKKTSSEEEEKIFTSH
jgi:hypothetical protein